MLLWLICSCCCCCSCYFSAAAAAAADAGLPGDGELRSALLVLLQGVDLQTVSYKQLHQQLEEKFKVRS
jgi:hypothetical protein